jgi:hypothetical protein
VNTDKLYTGQTFKNYKELCLELGLEVKKSVDTKNAQFKELSRYCKFNKIGHKIIIEEVYEKPLPKTENRGKNSIYGNLIQLLICDLLAQCKGHVSISKSKLMHTLGMVNRNYNECKEMVLKLSAYSDIDEKVIYDFYNTSSSSFKSIIETALNSLMDKRVIMFNKIIKIKELDKSYTRVATETELQTIMKIEKEILEELKYKQISAVRISKDWRKFKDKVTKSLHEQSNINFYYTAYDIAINEKYIIEERNYLINLLLEQVARQKSKDELNQLIYVNLLLNAQKRHEMAFTSKKMGRIRMPESYIENFKKLADLLIDKDADYIVTQVKSMEVFTPEMMEEFEKMFG